MSVLDLETFKAHVGLSGSEQDAAAQRILDAAEAAVARVIDSPLSVGTYTCTATSAGSVVLPHVNVSAVTSPAGVTVDAATGIAAGSFSAGDVLTYTAGFDALPADLELAVLELARHMWASTIRKGGNRAVESSAALGGYLLPAAVESLLAPHRSLGFA